MHRSGNKEVLACADKELVGKRLSFGEMGFEVSESFFKGGEASKGELARLLREKENINLVGEKCVSVALREGIAEKADVLMIGGVPHLQVFRV